MNNMARRSARSFPAFTYLIAKLPLHTSIGIPSTISSRSNLRDHSKRSYDSITLCVTPKSIELLARTLGMDPRSIKRSSASVFPPLSLRRPVSRRPFFVRFSAGGFLSPISSDPEIPLRDSEHVRGSRKNALTN